jgi:hypothetical protein
VVGLEKTTEWSTEATQQTVQKAGTPDQIVADNGREFISVWEERLTKFGERLDELDIDYVTVRLTTLNVIARQKPSSEP